MVRALLLTGPSSPYVKIYAWALRGCFKDKEKNPHLFNYIIDKAMIVVNESNLKEIIKLNSKDNLKLKNEIEKNIK